MPYYSYNSFGRLIVRGYIIKEDGEPIVFQFNPDQWNEPHKAIWNTVDSPGSSYPEINYIRQDKRQIQITLIFDGVGRNVDVEEAISKLIALTKPTGKKVLAHGGKQFVQPPLCKFIWGDIVKKVVITDVTPKREQFNSQLKTVVSSIDVVMLEYE